MHAGPVDRTGRRRRPEERDLAPVDVAELVADDRHDARELRGLDLSGLDLAGTRFLGCALLDCLLDDASLTEARLVESVLRRVSATTLRLAGSTWRDTDLADCRVGALLAAGSVLTRVQVTDGGLDVLDLRGAELTDVVFRGCRLGDVDLGGARLERVTFLDCRIGELEVRGATMHEVDLSRSELHVVGGVADLRGTVLSGAQLLDLMPAVAEHLGIRVSEPPSS